MQCLCQPVVGRTAKAVIGQFGEQAFVEQCAPCAKIGEHASIMVIALDHEPSASSSQRGAHPRQHVAPTSGVILPTWSKPGGIAESTIPASAATVHDLRMFLRRSDPYRGDSRTCRESELGREARRCRESENSEEKLYYPRGSESALGASTWVATCRSIGGFQTVRRPSTHETNPSAMHGTRL